MPPGFGLTLWNAVVKAFATNLSSSDLMLGVEGRKSLLQKIILNHRTESFPYWKYVSSLFLRKIFKWLFFSIFNLNLDIMKVLKHLLSATEVTTCSNRVETYHVKMLNDLVWYSGQFFKKNPLFFIIQDCVNQRKALFYRKVLLGNNFPEFDKNPGYYNSKTLQVETKPACQ